MIQIYSKHIPGTLLHVVHHFNEVKEGRVDFTPEDNFMQCAMIRRNAKDEFKPHKHLWKKGKKKVITQEAWVVLTGSVLITYYDFNSDILSTHCLTQYDMSITLQGGHSFKILENDTIVYEFKTGPYEGQVKDKEFI